MANGHKRTDGKTTGAQRELAARVLATLSRVTGSDFSDFRETTLQRRLSRRMSLLGISGIEEYLALLERDDAEVRSLFHDILINVTGFFREPDVFEILKETVFPQIISRDESDGIRLWVPGCSTGQEPYSLAIVLSECLEQAGATRQVQIFATDINEAPIAVARQGVYHEEIRSSVAPERLERYFDRTPAGWRVRKQIREMCVFAHHDLTRDPPFTRIDMVSCRNLLIYWNRSQQDRMLPLFHYALRPEGFLLLGSSESAAPFPELFEPLDRTARLYRRRETEVPPRVRFGPYGAHRLAAPSQPSVPARLDAAVAEAGRLVARENPSGAVLVDERLDALYFWGETAPFFLPSSGEATLNLARLVAHDLLSDTMSAIDEVRRRSLSAWRGPTTLGSGQRLFLHVAPIRPEAQTWDFLLLIGEQERRAGGDGAGIAPPGMERELESTREQLVTKVEELTVTNEELRTSEEQLHDANQALQGLVRGLEARNTNVQRLNDDLANVLSSVNIPLVVLDGEGRIRMSTTAAEALLGVRTDDVGRPFSDLASVETFPHLAALVAEALALDHDREHQIADRTGRAFLLRLSPYLAEDGGTEGVVLAFLDVEQAQRDVLAESARLMSALTAIDVKLNSVLDADEVMRDVAEAALEAIGADSLVLYRCVQPDWVVAQAAGFDEAVVGTTVSHDDHPFLEQDSPQELWSIPDIRADERLQGSLQARHRDRSVVAAQLVARDRVIGAIAFGWRRKVRASAAALGFVRGLGASVAVALENARLYKAQFQVADRLQQALLELPDRVKGIDFAAEYSAASDEARVGGDFFDVFEMEGDLVAIVIGDVSGKGLDAAVLTALARNALRAHALEECDPAVAFTKMNRLVFRFTSTEMYLTAFFGVLDVKSGALTYCSAGHPPAIIVHPQGTELLGCANPILGATEHLEYVAGTADLGARDTLLLCTDGITEARRDGELFGTERLLRVVESVSRSRPDQLLASVMQEVREFARGHLQDDAALLAVRRTTRHREG